MSSMASFRTPSGRYDWREEILSVNTFLVLYGYGGKGWTHHGKERYASLGVQAKTAFAGVRVEQEVKLGMAWSSCWRVNLGVLQTILLNVLLYDTHRGLVKSASYLYQEFHLASTSS
jgi:hypothetical protein